MDNFIRLTKTRTLEAGSCSPLIFVEGTNGNGITIPFVGADSSEERILVMFLTGKSLSREENVGKLKQVCFVNEGWMGFPRDGEFIRPSKDPDRVEALLFSCLNVDKNKQTLEILKMVRDRNGKLTDLLEFQMHKAVEVKSDLLPAFVSGYLSTSKVCS